MSAPAEVLFLCVRNAGRSQMAAALLERIAGDGARVRSGGSSPAEEIHENVREAMREIGIDLTGRRPRGFTEDDVRAADVVVTMGCGDECPYVPGVRYEDWDVGDPAGEPIETVRAIRDDLDARVRRLLDSLS